MPDNLKDLAARGYRMVSPEEYAFLKAALKFGNREMFDLVLLEAPLTDADADEVYECIDAYNALFAPQKDQTDAKA